MSATVESKLYDFADRAKMKVFVNSNSIKGDYLRAALVGKMHVAQMEQIKDRLYLRGIEVVETLDLREGARRVFEGLDLVLILFENGSHQELGHVADNAKAHGVRSVNISRKSARWPADLCHPSSAHVAELLAQATDEDVKAMIRTGIGAVDAEAEAALVLAAKIAAENERLRKEVQKYKADVDAALATAEQVEGNIVELEQRIARLKEENEELMQRSTMPMTEKYEPPFEDGVENSTPRPTLTMKDALRFIKQHGLANEGRSWNRGALLDLLTSARALEVDISSLIEMLEES